MTRGALYAQAVRGPLLLITVGGLCALNQAEVISFWRTWPLIIIIVGLIKLVERLAGPQSVPYPQQPPYPPTGAPRV